MLLLFILSGCYDMIPNVDVEMSPRQRMRAQAQIDPTGLLKLNVAVVSFEGSFRPCKIGRCIGICTRALQL